MKKITASVVALLMICSSPTSALNKESTVKKVVYNVCTKVLPIAAVTLGAGFLVKKFVIDRENNDPTHQRLASENDSKINANCGNSSNSTEKKDKSSNNVPLTEQQAYADGIRYIKWQANMCWFNASILYLYYNNYYRYFLCDGVKEVEYSKDDDIQKKIIIALANLVKKIKNSETCMCELSKQEYESVLSLYGKYDSTHRANYEFGKSKNQMVDSFVSLIDSYISTNLCGTELSELLTVQRNDEGIRVVYEGTVFKGNNNEEISRGHYYNLYSNKQVLYSIGKSTNCDLNSSVRVVKSKDKLYTWFEEKDLSKIIYKVKYW